MRLWEDGFDHYGVDTTKMLDGPYGQADNVGGSLVPSTAQQATGTHSMWIAQNTGLTAWAGLRKVLPAAVTKIGIMARFWLPTLPTYPYANGIAHLLPVSGLSESQLSFQVGVNGEIHIIQGRDQMANIGDSHGGVLIGSTDPVLTTNAWNHIEMQAYIHDSQGWARIAVNGIHRYEVTGKDTQFDATGIASVGQNVTLLGHENAGFYMDDYIIYDFTGDSAVDTDFCPTVDGAGKATSYIGELQVWPLFPNGDTVEADFLKSTGVVGYSLINEAAPNDATYIYSTAAGDLSEFDLQDLPPEITYVRGLGVHARMSKADAGAALVKIGMHSAAATSDAAERPLTVAPTYWRDMRNLDPNTGARWTRAGLNAAKLRLTRSA